MVSHERVVSVRWGECDPAGIVFYPRFFEWFDRSTEALFTAVGLRWPALFAQYRVSGVSIVESGARFTAPVRHGDEARIRSAVKEVRDKTFRVDHEVSVNGTPCATGFEVRAWIALPDTPGGRLRSASIPAEVAARLKGEARP